MSHMPLARRYRPQKFSDVIGQPQATRALQNALMSGKTSHAYLFSGTRGCGKTTLARLLAKAVNCLALTAEAEPCQTCASCLEIAGSHSLDVIEIDGASHRGIDDIRQIKESVGFQPSTGKFKVYIVDEVHMLTKEAFNALLKTLEEPPSTVKFILATTEPHKVPATISSRCQRFALRNIEPAQVVQALEKILKQESVEYEADLLWHLGRRCEGSLRDCLSLLDQLLAFEPEKLTLKGLQEILGLAPLERLQSWENLLDSGKIEEVFSLVRDLQDSGIEVGVFLEQLQEHYQNILKATYGIIEGPLDIQQAYKGFKDKYRVEEILFILNRLDESFQNLKYSHHPRLHLEMTLLHLIQKPWKCTIDHLVNRLEEMKAQLHHGQAVSHESTKTSASTLNPPATLVTTGAASRPKELTSPSATIKSSPIDVPAIETRTPPLVQEAPKKTLTPPVVTAPVATPSPTKTSQTTPPATFSSVTQTMPPGTFEGLIQFAARELGGHLR